MKLPRSNRYQLTFAAIIAIPIAVFLVAGSPPIQEYLGRVLIDDTEGAAMSATPGASGPSYRPLAKDAIIYSNREGVLEQRDQFIAEKTDFIFADLNAMQIDLYQGGAIVHSAPIRAKGKVGTFFETPNGFYRIQSKEENHFSSIGEVWMPWSMHFFGNYFIHGWPYYPSGTPVAESYSGGCIRLGTEDAKILYRMSKNGMAVLTYSGEETPALADNTRFFRKVEGSGRHLAEPKISAPAALAADLDTGQILYERDAKTPYPIASITKLMTALTAVETINRFKVLTIPEDVLVDTLGDSAGLVSGETFRSEDLLYPLILESSNDVAELYRRQAWEFVATMNQKSRAIGMGDTHFVDASGVSPDNVSSPQDLFRLLRYVYSYKKPIFNIAALPSHAATSTNGLKAHMWANVNWPEDEHFLGGKAGKTTEAHETMLGLFKVKFSEYGDRKIVVIVLGATNRVSDVREITNYLEGNFVYGSVFVEQGVPASPIRSGANIYEAIGTKLERLMK